MCAEDGDIILVANVTFHPFVEASDVYSQCSVVQALNKISKRNQSVIQNAFETWVAANVNLSKLRTLTSIASPAALVAMHLIRNPRYCKPFNAHITSYPSPKLSLTIQLADLHGPQREILAPNFILQSLFWHLDRISESREHFPPSICGFAGCDQACCPQEDNQRWNYHLNRVYHSLSMTVSRRTKFTKQSDQFMEPTQQSNNNNVSRSNFLSLPEELLFRIASTLSAPDLAALSDSNSLLTDLLFHVVPGLNLRLYPHQVSAIRQMIAMESSHACKDPVPLLHSVTHPNFKEFRILIDLADGSVMWRKGLPRISSPNGGLFCDEPGLGKTISVIALILKTLGKRPSIPSGCSKKEIEHCDYTEPVQYYQEQFVGRFQSYGEQHTSFPDRKVRLLPDATRTFSSSRRVKRTDFLGIGQSSSVPSVDDQAVIYISRATLIIVPYVLISHWQHQLTKHVTAGVLRTLFVRSKSEISCDAIKLANNYDTIVISFQAIRDICAELRTSACALLRVHFLRVVIDEGHQLTSANVSNFTSVCHRVRAENRWVMTGTPTPSSPRSDVDHLYSLLSFIREEAYGLDLKAWKVGIRTPYSQFKKEGLERLKALLRRVMIRADKSILKSRCNVRNVFLEFSAPSADSYNSVVRIVRRNLITSDWFSESHKESLLNQANFISAKEAIKNLRLACCAGGTASVKFDNNCVGDTLEIMYEKYRQTANICENNRFLDPTNDVHALETPNKEGISRIARRNKDLLEELISSGKPFSKICQHRNTKNPCLAKNVIYSGLLHDIANAFLTGKSFCELCRGETALPMVTPCGHLLCDDCILKDKYRCVAENCGKPYKMDKNEIPENLIELQPSASSNTWKKGWEEMESAKIKYLIDRILNLPNNEEWEPQNVMANVKKPKVIVHSEYGDHLKMVALKLKSSQLCDAYVEMTQNIKDITEGIKGRRASEIAEESVQRFRTDEKVNILLMNSKHGAVGLDLSFVQYVFFLEPVWDSSLELQVISRAHRIGCNHDITVERLIMKNSVEEFMLRDSTLTSLHQQSSGVAEERAEYDRRRISRILHNLKIVRSMEDFCHKKENPSLVITEDHKSYTDSNSRDNERPQKRVRFVMD